MAVLARFVEAQAPAPKREASRPSAASNRSYPEKQASWTPGGSADGSIQKPSALQKLGRGVKGLLPSAFSSGSLFGKARPHRTAYEFWAEERDKHE
jgi:hypothetical protein